MTDRPNVYRFCDHCGRVAIRTPDQDTTTMCLRLFTNLAVSRAGHPLATGRCRGRLVVFPDQAVARAATVLGGMEALRDLADHLNDQRDHVQVPI